MNKKNYIVPAVTIVNVNMQYTLMAGSQVGVSSVEYSEGSNGPIRSRGTSLWDDEEE